MPSSAPAITEFTFDKGLPDPDALTQAWVPAIEQASFNHITDDRFKAFLVAAIRLGANSRRLEGVNVLNLVEKAGYSRSTFFRLFESHTNFLLTGYHLTCSLSIEVYRDLLKCKEMSIEEFAQFTTDVFYGANCTVPNEISQMLWQAHGVSHKAFHPHLPKVSKIILEYLKSNPATSELDVDQEELDGIIHTLDWDMLQARIDLGEVFPTLQQHKRLKRILYGYLVSLA